MTPHRTGRHCAQCKKNVIDFTDWSDAALYNYFVNNKENVCGRFLSTQINRPIYIPHQPHSRLYRMTIAFGLTLLFTQTPQLLAQNRPPLITQTTTDAMAQKDTSKQGNIGALYGNIFDEKHEPLINATVQVFQNGLLKGGNITDYDGNFAISHLEVGKYEVLVLYVGYDSLKSNVEILAGQSVKQNFVLNRKPGFKMGLIFMGMPIRAHMDFDNPNKKTFTREEIGQMPH